MYNLRSLQLTDKSLTRRFKSLDIGDKVLVTYIWIDDFGSGEDLRCKTKTMEFEPTKPEEVPTWNHGRLEAHATPENDELETFLKPVALFKDPFHEGKHKLVLCETVDSKGKPSGNNHRGKCKELMDLVKDQKPWFGFEQEYMLFDVDGEPFGWAKQSYPKPSGLTFPAYCGIGANKVYGRDISDAHYFACLYAGVHIYGSNAECMSPQWEYQVGPVEGIAFSDHVWMARFILLRVAEEYGVAVSFKCKPIDVEGHSTNGGHINFSTKAMREDGGIEAITEAAKKLGEVHLNHLAYYDPHNGKENEKRLRGEVAAPDLKEYTWSASSRAVSVRIPFQVSIDGKGYLEDRRPAANCDPYLVTRALVTTCCLKNSERRLSRIYTPPNGF